MKQILEDHLSANPWEYYKHCPCFQGVTMLWKYKETKQMGQL